MFLLLLNVTILTSEPLSGVFNLKRVSPSYMDRNFCIWFCFMGLGWRLAALGRGGVGIFTAQRDISQRLIYSWLLLIEIWFGEGWFVPLLFRDHISDSSRLFLFREKKALILLSIELRFFFHLFGLLQYYHRESGHNCWKEQLLLWHYWRYNLCTCRGRGGGKWWCFRPSKFHSHQQRGYIISLLNFKSQPPPPPPPANFGQVP